MKPLPKYAQVLQNEKEETKPRKINLLMKIFSMIEWSLLKSPYFIFILSINGVFMTSFLLQLTEIAFITEARGFSISEKANLFTIMNTCDIFTKIVQGFIADFKPIKRTFRHPMKFLYRFNVIGMTVTMIGLGLVDSIILLTDLFRFIFRWTPSPSLSRSPVSRLSSTRILQ